MDAVAKYKTGKHEREYRRKIATLCRYYPQYEYSEFFDDGKHVNMAKADIDTLIATANHMRFEEMQFQLSIMSTATHPNKTNSNGRKMHNMFKKILKREEQSI